MIEKLTTALAATTGLDPALIRKTISINEDLTLGDLAFPCFALAKTKKMPPPACATALQNEIKLPEGFASVRATGPYLNFTFDRKVFAEKTVQEILAAGNRFGAGPKIETTILVEYSSPNIAKPFHIGHLRTILIGRAIERVYRHLGYNVITIDHIGDWGTQFGYVYAGCKLFGEPASETIDGLLERYRQASKLSKAQEAGEQKDQPDVTAMAREYFTQLEAGDAKAKAFWQRCLDISLSYLQTIYRRLGVAFDHTIGESFYSDKLAAVEKMIRDRGILENSRGALGVDLGKPLGFARIFADDGRSLYLTREVATAHYRTERFKPERILHVVGAPQELHFRQLIEVLKKIDHPAAKSVTHVPYGHVPGISTRNSSKDADRFYLTELLDEAHERALDAYRNQVAKRPEGLDENTVAEAVGQGALVFHYLKQSNIKELHFDWNDALNFQGDTGPYVQYALARLNGIQEKAAAAGITASKAFDGNALVAADGNDGKAYAIVAILARFPDCLNRVAQENEPYHLTQYILSLARAISSAYKDLRVVGEEAQLAGARLALFDACRNVLKTGMTLLGIPAIERM